MRREREPMLREQRLRELRRLLGERILARRCHGHDDPVANSTKPTIAASVLPTGLATSRATMTC